jgi:hypothetical protein
MARTACLVCLIGTVSGHCKIGENALDIVALVAGTQQDFINLYSLDIYGSKREGGWLDLDLVLLTTYRVA